jgi:transcriptional regulator with XRE-family HTH domain
MLDLPTLGEAVARRRSALKLTQTGLATRAKVGRSTIDSLENGRAGELGFTKVARILAALDLDLRLTEAGHGRPTLEDLLRDNDDQGLGRRR